MFFVLLSNNLRYKKIFDTNICINGIFLLILHHQIKPKTPEQEDKVGKDDMTYQVNHGTNETFSKFDASFLGKNTDGNATDESFAQTAHLGFWFNEGGDLSIAYDKIMRCAVEIENPCHIDSIETLAFWIESSEKTADELRSQLVEEGYDGIIIEDEEFGGTSYVAFDVEQITML